MATPINEIRSLIAQELGVPSTRLTRDTRLRDDLGIDSVLAINILFAFERDYDIRVSEEDLVALSTVGDLEMLIKTLLDGNSSRS